MNDYVTWLVLAFGLVIGELFTGTFYLLMVAVGFAVAGVAAFFGAPPWAQLLAGAAVGSIATLLLHRRRAAHSEVKIAAERNPDMVLDIGQTVLVEQWQAGHARIRYRGSDWDAVPESPAEAPTGELVIKAVRGNTLVLGAGEPATA